MLEKEEWRYDAFPEFYNGSNVLDFYDPDIEKKLTALEKEEDELLKMEADEGDVMQVDEDLEAEGLNLNQMKQSLKEVRSKKAIFKLQHKLHSKLKVHPKNVKLSTMVEHFESKGLNVNKESLRSRSKVRRSIADLEGAQDELARKALDSDGGDDEIIDDADLAAAEAKDRGRKRRRDRSVDPDDFMDVDETVAPKPLGRSMTPAQRTITARKMHRSKTAGRREGSEPQRLPYKLVPEEQIRLAKKINKAAFGRKIQISEADRVIQQKKPKHLFAGKMSNGTKHHR